MPKRNDIDSVFNHDQTRAKIFIIFDVRLIYNQ